MFNVFMRRLISARRLWRLLAVTLMLGSAFSFIRTMGDAAAVSAWTGLAQYATVIPSVQRDAIRFEVAAFVLPFIAAVALSLASPSGRSDNRSLPALETVVERRRRSTTIITSYGLNVAISFLGSASWFVVIYLIAVIASKTRPHV